MFKFNIVGGVAAFAVAALLCLSSVAMAGTNSMAASDKADYDARLAVLARVSTSTQTQSAKVNLWSVKTVYPNAGATLPFKRIVAFYGNFYSTRMGVLGEYPAEEMLSILASTTAKWTAADPTTPALPAIQYIAIVAQASAGKDGKYIARMPDSQIDHALDLANRAHGILILDLQVGKSTLEQELPRLEKYLQMPQVHLAIDPEFSMKYGQQPGKAIGTFDATDINYAARYLANLVQKYQLPPKVLIVHRFTQKMVTNYKEIRPLPEVQIVMDMDGWGSKAKKKDSYNGFIKREPVQFTGIKIFAYGKQNDLKPPSTGLFTPGEVLGLMPSPIYVQYQ